MPAHTPLPPLTFTGSKCLKSIDDCAFKMTMISSDVVLSKFMVKTRFRGEAASVNVKDFVVAVVSLSLGVCAAVLLFALMAIRNFTIYVCETACCMQ